MVDNDFKYDAEIGADKVYVCIGDCALYRAGLIYQTTDTLMVSTLDTELRGIGTWKALYYCSPWAGSHFETHPSPACGNILIPTQERALLETIFLHEYFNEGVLIEALKSYMEQHESLEHIYEVGVKYFPKNARELLDYWFEEARLDDSVCGA